MIHFVRITPKRWLYFGTEDEVAHARLWEKFWFLEENAPHRIGNGWRSKRHDDLALHIGIAKKNPLATSNLEILGGNVMAASPEEIGLWGVEDPEDHAGEGPSEAGPSHDARGAELR